MIKDYFSRDDLKRILNLTLADCVDVLFSHNSTIAIWIEELDNGLYYRRRLWRGMAWALPDFLQDCYFRTFFGVIPEGIMESDTLNIEMVVPDDEKLTEIENKLRILKTVEELNKELQEENEKALSRLTDVNAVEV